MCFPGAKKARSFDVMAMFQEARNTAIERSYKPIGMYELILHW